MVYEYNNISSVNLDKLHYEVALSAMTDKSLISCTWNESDLILKLKFTNAISAGDKTILDGIVAAHSIIFPDADFLPQLFLKRLTEEFNGGDRKRLSKSAPSFVTELAFHKFDACKICIDEAYSDTDITLAEKNTLYNLFVEQNIDLNNY